VRATRSIQVGWNDVESVYDVPSFGDVLAGCFGAEGADDVVAGSFDAGVAAPSPDDVVAGVELSDPELSDPEDSVEELSAEAVLAEPAERLSVL
jgi:hypothetical protein